MSERTVSENNKLWENAEKIAQQVVAEKKAESEEERRKQKKRVIKLVLLLVLIALIIVFASIHSRTIQMTTGNTVSKAFQAYFYVFLSVHNFVQRENLQELTYALQVF